VIESVGVIVRSFFLVESQFEPCVYVSKGWKDCVYVAWPGKSLPFSCCDT